MQNIIRYSQFNLLSFSWSNEKLKQRKEKTRFSHLKFFQKKTEEIYKLFLVRTHKLCASRLSCVWQIFSLPSFNENFLHSSGAFFAHPSTKALIYSKIYKMSSAQKWFVTQFNSKWWFSVHAYKREKNEASWKPRAYIIKKPSNNLSKDKMQLVIEWERKNNNGNSLNRQIKSELNIVEHRTSE